MNINKRKNGWKEGFWKDSWYTGELQSKRLYKNGEAVLYMNYIRNQIIEKKINI